MLALFDDLLSVTKETRLRKPAIVLLSIFIPLLLVALSVCSEIGKQSADDYVISIMSSAPFPKSSPVLFLLNPLGLLLNQLGGLAPAVNWFYLFERIVAWLSFSYVTAATLLYTDSKTRAFTIIAIIGAFLLRGSIQESNFTYVASLATLSGSAGLLISTRIAIGKAKIKPCLAIFGIILFILGMCIRIQSWLLVIPFFLLALLIIVLKYWHSASRGSKIRCISFVAFSFLLSALVLIGSEVCYQSEEHDYWQEYNTERGKIVDYPHPSFEEMREDLEAIGISENDFSLLCSISSFDNEVFTLEKMKQVTSVLDSHPPSLETRINASLKWMRNAGMMHLVFIAAMLLAICFAMIAYETKGRLAFSAFLMIGLLASAYFILAGRFPDRVEYAIWIYAIVLGLETIESNRRGPSRRRIRISITSLLMILMVAISLSPIISFSLAYGRNMQSASFYASDNVVFQNINADDSDFYLLAFPMQQESRELYDYRYIPARTFIDQNLYSAGWVLESPQWFSVLDNKGLDSSIKWLVDKDDAYVLDMEGSSRYLSILTFIQEHYYPQAEIKIIETWTDDEGREVLKIDYYLPE